MNTHTARALFKDAFFQVLDNMVFRLLVIVVFCLIAPTFLVSFGKDEISILFGWKTIAYSDLSTFFGGSGALGPNPHEVVIQQVQSLFVESLAGNFGVLLCLAATAFFVPRMLEKGEADTLFSKPIGRFTLLFARYSAGVLFVGLLALVLVLGMHLGFLLRSGYSDPGFLWGALTLTYVFALIHAFSTAVGVMTRSSVAALLLSIILFMFNGCIHQVWTLKEYGTEVERLRTESAEDDTDMLQGSQTNPAVKFLAAVLDGFHYVLPKTNDADVLTKQLRKAVAGGDFVIEDPGGKLAVVHDPDALARGTTEREVDLSASPATWTASEGGREVARLTLGRKLRTVEKKSGDKVRTVRTSASTAANELVKSLNARTDLEGKPTRSTPLSDGAVRELVSWKERRDGALVARDHAFLPLDDWMYEIDVAADAGWYERNSQADALQEFFRALKPQRDRAGDIPPDEWYERRFGFGGPTKYNAIFSLSTSIAFAALMLLIARWRLSRIDF